MNVELSEKIFNSWKNEILEEYWKEGYEDLDKCWKNIMFRFFKKNISVDEILDEVLYGNFLGERCTNFMEVLVSCNSLIL